MILVMYCCTQPLDSAEYTLSRPPGEYPGSNEDVHYANAPGYTK